MSSLAFKKALEHFGGNQSAFAKAVGTSQQRISYVAHRGNSCPPELVLATERATGISRHKLRPDLYPIEHAPPADATSIAA